MSSLASSFDLNKKKQPNSTEGMENCEFDKL